MRYNDNLSGKITIENDDLISGRIYEFDKPARDFDTTVLEVNIADYLDVIDLNTSQVPEPCFLSFILIFQWCFLKVF